LIQVLEGWEVAIQNRIHQGKARQPKTMTSHSQVDEKTMTRRPQHNHIARQLHYKTRQDNHKKRRQDKIRQDKIGQMKRQLRQTRQGQDKSKARQEDRQDKTRQDKTRQDKTRHKTRQRRKIRLDKEAKIKG
jgi:hypothetical protein